MDMSAVQPGSVIDRYTVESVVGQGGMALVIRVRHNQLGTAHALKILTIATPAIRDRLLQEGRVQASLKHPHVVNVTDLVVLPNGSPGLIMEMVEGPSLEQLLVAERLTLEQADVIARGVLEGVAEAHRIGLVHRDLKPANILLEPGDGTYVAKVADFGLAKVLAGEPGHAHTRTGMSMGTPQYMAPEQVRDSKSVGPQADVFALGAILYELVTGVRAFDSDDMLEIFNAVADGRYVPVREIATDPPDAMVAAIEAALQVDPSARPASVADLRDIWVGERGALKSVAAFPEVSRVVSLTRSDGWQSNASTLDQSGSQPPPVAEVVVAEASSGDSLVARRAVALAGGGLVFAAGGLVLIAVAAAGLVAWALWEGTPQPPAGEPAAQIAAGTPSSPPDGDAPPVADSTGSAVAVPVGEMGERAPPPDSDPSAVGEPSAEAGSEPMADPEPAADPVADTEPTDEPDPEADEVPVPEPDEELATGQGEEDAAIAERRAEIRELAQIRNRESCEKLVAIVRSSEPDEIREFAWQTVRDMLEAGHGDVAVLQELVAWQLRVGRPKFAQQAAATLGKTATRPELLFPGLDHRAPGVKIATLDAVMAMAKRVPDQRWWFKVKPLTRSGLPKVRTKAMEVLARL